MRGILLINIGTPAICSKEAVRKFVGDMLSDPLVAGKPGWISSFLAKKIVAPASSGRSFRKYNQIWRKRRARDLPMIYFITETGPIAGRKKRSRGNCHAIRWTGDWTGVKNLEKKCPLTHEVVVFPLTSALRPILQKQQLMKSEEFLQTTPFLSDKTRWALSTIIHVIYTCSCKKRRALFEDISTNWYSVIIAYPFTR